MRPANQPLSSSFAPISCLHCVVIDVITTASERQGWFRWRLRPAPRIGLVRTAVALLTLSAVAFGFTYSDHAPLIPLVSAEFRLDDLGAGLLSTSLFTSYLFTTLLTTGLAERLGPKRIVGAGLAVSTLGTLAFAIAPNYAAALIAKAIQGIGSAL